MMKDTATNGIDMNCGSCSTFCFIYNEGLVLLNPIATKRCHYSAKLISLGYRTYRLLINYCFISVQNLRYSETFTEF
jgi:hypothetical protein